MEHGGRSIGRIAINGFAAVDRSPKAALDRLRTLVEDQRAANHRKKLLLKENWWIAGVLHRPVEPAELISNDPQGEHLYR